MLFLGRKWQKKNAGESKGNEISRFAFGLHSGPSTLLGAERRRLRRGILWHA
jgi:hypothetical protein